MTTGPRESTADLLKGTALVLMVQVHIMELFAQPDILGSWVGKASLLLGGPPVAPVFLAVMGYFAGRPTKNRRSLVQRGVMLLGLGLMLNLGLNAHLLWKIYRGTTQLDPWGYILGVDILLLAGWSLLIIALIRPLLGRHPWPWVVAAISVVLLTPLANEHLTTDGPLKWVFAHIAGGYWWSYFPLLPWLAYPLLGAAVRLWRESETKAGSTPVVPGSRWRVSVLTLVLPITVLAITGSTAIYTTHDLSSYYHHDALFFLWVVIFLVPWGHLHARADQYLGHTVVARWLKWMGRHVSTVYIFQWLIIGNIATAIYKTQDLGRCSLWLAAVLVSASVLTAVTGAVWTGWARQIRDRR